MQFDYKTDWSPYFGDQTRAALPLQFVSPAETKRLVKWIVEDGLVEYINGERRIKEKELYSSIGVYADHSSIKASDFKVEVILEYVIQKFLMEPWADENHPLRALGKNSNLASNYLFGQGLLTMLVVDGRSAHHIFKMMALAIQEYRKTRTKIIDLMFSHLYVLGISDEFFGKDIILNTAWDGLDGDAGGED